MKKLIFIPILLILINSTPAQPYKSCFGKKTTEWNILGGIGDMITQKYKILGEKKINGLLYKELGGPNYLREDISTGKLWILQATRKDSVEYLLMDLSLSVGDTFHLSFSQKDYNPETIAIVDSVYFDNLGRKVVRTNYNFGVPNFKRDYKLTFFEGVGPNASVFFPFVRYFKMDSQLLLCFYNDNFLYYQNTELNGICEYNSVSIYKDFLSNFEIKYNPYEQIITIKSNNQLFGKLLIINMLGVICKNVSINSNNQLIELGNLQKGLFIIYYIDLENKLKFIKKIINF